MDITIGDSEVVDNNENLLIHVFFNLFNYDFRSGMFTNDSSIYDMSGTNFKDEDYVELAKEYYEQSPENYSYTQGQKLYQKLSNAKFDKNVFESFEKTYGFPLKPEQHLLKDVVLVLKEKFPTRNWDTENIFIFKTLDFRLKKEEEEEERVLAEEKKQKVVKLPVRKKPSREEIKVCFNEYLISREFGIPFEEARILARANLEKAREGKKFTPYLPETQKNKPKM